MAFLRSDQVRDRISSVCAGHPFGFSQSVTPFSFDLQPSGDSDQVFRVESATDAIVGGFNFQEERSDEVLIWVARHHKNDPEASYRTLVTDASSIRAAVIRDAHVTSGQYSISDEGGMSIQRDAGKQFAVLRLMVTAMYEAEV